VRTGQEENDELFFDLADLKLSQDSQIEFIGADTSTDWTIDLATDETLLFTPSENDDTSTFNIGNATYTSDLLLFGKTASTVTFDASADNVLFDAYDIQLGDDDVLAFGDGKDVTISQSSANLLTFGQTVAGTGAIAWGVDGAGLDNTFYGDTASAKMLWDTSADQLVVSGGAQISLNDDVELLFGTGASNAGDFSITGSSSPLLTIDVVTPGSGEIAIGNDANDVPLKWYAETASDWVYFNADEVEFEDVVLQLMDDTEIQLGDGDDAIIRYDETTDDNLEIVVASSGMSIVADDFITTTDGASANQFKVDATGTIADASGDAIVFETTSGGILLDANNASNGDIGLDAEDDLRLTSGGDMILTIGGHARVVDDDLVSFGTTDNVTMNYDEDGDDNLQIVGPVDFETTYVEFRSNPVGMQNDGTVWSGTNTETNTFIVDGVTFEQYIIGTVSSPVPVLTDDGLNIAMDEADDEGCEIGQGITARNPHYYTTNTDSFYLKVKFKLETVSSSDIIAIGFRKAGAYDVDMYAYTDFSCINVDNGTVNIEHELSDGGLSSSDSGETWADGETHTLEVRIDGDGESTYYFDGAETTNDIDFDWTENDTVIPFIHHLFDATAGNEIELISYECGIYNQ